jgi:hypothetical protein
MTKRFKGVAPRWVALGVVAVIAIGGYMISPAIGGGGLTAKQAKRLFYTKNKSNDRFARARCCYSKSQADGRYLSRNGVLRFNATPSDWAPVSDTTAQITYFNNEAEFTENAQPDQSFRLGIQTPQRLFDRQLRFSGVELCYAAETNSTLDLVEMLRERATVADPTGGGSTAAEDSTDRTDSTCRTYTPSSPVELQAGDSLVFRLRIDFGASGVFRVSRVSVLLAP